MNGRKLTIIIMFIVGVLFVPIYWLTDVAIIGVVGYTALCLANGYVLFYELFKKKQDKNNEKEN